MGMKLLIFFFYCACLTNALQAQQIIPFRDEASYKFVLDYNFEAKPPPPKNLISWSENARSSGLLPYVKIKIQMLNVRKDDHRVKVVNNKGHAVYNKRTKGPMEINFDLGFTEDIIHRLVPHLFYVHFSDKDKNIHSQVVIEVTETGKLLLNEQVYGQL